MDTVSSDIMTPSQVATYLQVDRETVYRYIRQGKLTAAKFGRSYRIPRRNLELLLWAVQGSEGTALRDYSRETIDSFMQDDALNDTGRGILNRFPK